MISCHVVILMIFINTTWPLEILCDVILVLYLWSILALTQIEDDDLYQTLIFHQVGSANDCDNPRGCSDGFLSVAQATQQKTMPSIVVIKIFK